MSDNKLECITCDYIAPSEYLLKIHNKGKNHILHELENTGFKLTRELIIELFEYYCKKCNYYTNYNNCWNTHLKGNKHLMSTEEYKKYLTERGKKLISKGDELEQFFALMLKECKDIEKVEILGFTGNKYDISVKYKDENYFRGIQIKSFKIKSDNGYDVKLGKYENDTLIVASNHEHKIFIMFLYEIANNKNSITFTYGNGNTYNKYIYDNMNKFKEELFINVKKSTILKNHTDSLTKEQKQEYESLERFNNVCNKYGLKYMKNNTNGNEIDCYINNYKIQHKSSTQLKNKLIRFNMFTGSTRRNSDRPYSENVDVNFFIFECVLKKYQNIFYIIPKEVLIKQKILKTSENKGQTYILLPLNDYTSHTSATHWGLQYINKFELLNGKSLSKPILQSLDKKLTDEKLEYKIHNNKIIIIENKKIIYRYSTYEHGKNKFRFEIGKNKIPFNKGDYDYYVFEIGKYKGNYYIVPEKYLIDQKYIKTKNNIGNSRIIILDPNIKENNWSLEYLNKFEQFRN